MKKNYWIIIISLFLNSCDYRTPSNVRFEKITKIALPNSMKVIQDIFEESGPDYSLFFKVSFNENDCLEMLEKIQKSKTWTKDASEWKFYKTIDGITFNIVFSVEKCQISYNEDLI